MAHEHLLFDEITELGFDLHHTTPTTASYSKEYNGYWIHIEIARTTYDQSKYNATLSTIFKMSELRIGPFQFPNKNYNMFEREIKYIIKSVGDLTDVRF